MKIESVKTFHNVKPPFICAYGPSGVGKTTLIKTLPGKTLVLDGENGLASIAGSDIDFISLARDPNTGRVFTDEERYKRITEFMAFVKNPETIRVYQNIVIDSLTEIGQNILQHMKGKFTGWEVYGQYNDAMSKLIKYFRDLGTYTCVFTALETYDGEEGAEQYQPLLGGKKAQAALLPMFDLVLRLTLDKEGKRIIVCNPTAKTQAKDRTGLLAPIEPPSLGNIITKIKTAVSK